MRRSRRAKAKHEIGHLLALIALAFVLRAAPAAAQDDAFQSFLTNACANPQAALASRCGETFAGQGGISTASQSSLNPNQALAGPSSASSYARERAKESRARQIEDPSVDEARLEFGQFSLMLNGRAVSQSFGAGADPSRERAYDLGSHQLEFGADYRPSQRTVIGAWLEWRESKLEFERAAPIGNVVPDFDTGQVNSDSTGGALFAGFDFSDVLHLDLALGYSDSDYDIERRALFEPLQAGDQPGPVTTVATRARTAGNDRWGTINLGRRVEAASWSFDPFVGLTWSSAEIDAYAEQDLSGSGLAMRIGDVQSDAVTGVVGFDARRIVSLSRAVLIPQFHFEYGYGLDTDATGAFASFLLDTDGNNQLALAGDEPDRDFARAGIGLVAVIQGGWSFYVDLQSTIGVQHVDRYAIAAGIRLEL